MHEWLFSICPLLLTVFENVASKHVISSIAIVMLAYRTVMTRMYLDVVRVYGFEHLTLTCTYFDGIARPLCHVGHVGTPLLLKSQTTPQAP